jgi:hypothetical protein
MVCQWGFQTAKEPNVWWLLAMAAWIGLPAVWLK